MKKTWKGHLTVVLVVAMMLTMALPAFAVEVEDENPVGEELTGENQEDIAENHALYANNRCPLCGEEIHENKWYTKYTDNGNSGHTIINVIVGEHCGITYYEREDTVKTEPHSRGSETVVEESHRSDLPPSEHYVIYEWKCGECHHITRGDPQSTGCTAVHCNWQRG